MNRPEGDAMIEVKRDEHGYKIQSDFLTFLHK